MERLLRGGDIRRVAFPGFQYRSLQCAPVGEAQLPREIRKSIHRVEMFSGLLIALPAREKHESRNSGGHYVFHAAHSSFGNFLH